MRWRTDTQPDPSLLRTRGVYITPYILSNKLFSFAGLFQHHLHPVAANRTQRGEAAWASLTVLLYVLLHLGRKKKKAENNKKYKLQQQYLLESDSSLQQGATLTTSEPHTLTPLNLTTHIPEPDRHSCHAYVSSSATLQKQASNKVRPSLPVNLTHLHP